jgi:hypothetical protein
MDEEAEINKEFWLFSTDVIGTKQLESIPMTLGEYNQIRGWDIPANENPDDDGFIVKYPDGHISWSPADQFLKAYRQSGEMSFGHAIHLLKQGKKMARVGWNGNDMFIFLVPGSRFNVNRPPLLGIYDEGTEINYQPHIDMCTADGTIVPWLGSQSDMLADDWFTVPGY